MGNAIKWIVSTLLLAGLMLGLALILLLLAAGLASILNERYHVDDDWSLLALPVGAVVGLILGVRYRVRRWLRVLAGILLAFSIGLAVWCSIPIQAPEGMQGLGIAMGNMIRKALLYTVLISGGVSLAAAAIANAILSLLPKQNGRARDGSEPAP